MSIRTACTLLLLFAVATPAAAQEAVYVIRHGEKELSGDEPALTPEGRDRAAGWARMLRHAGLDAVITSDALRTRETGAIIAEALDLRASAWPATDIAGLVDTLEFDHEDDRVLVVAHAETIPGILARLGVLDEISVDQTEFANLFVVTGPGSDNPVFLHLFMP
ncbi:phosphoglycerate mutase family protein [Ruegeria aquimaris]|uniref:Histidine phosphatase family protein n=1 Tax=Ruegeria aquimaris TaxID=2984333 RepID=A0ABT3AQA2_9RHOB|nr:phosphoglycerate mutase family protein [Ruegeria sp. XHP0148]MCV2890846.1 histidine phosphatase family protein [Ruegeria sp. XHP0148]